MPRSFAALIVICLIYVFLVPLAARTPVPEKKVPNLEEITVAELTQRYRDGSLTVEAAVNWYLERIKAIDQAGPKLNSVIVVNPDALVIARKLDQDIKAGRWIGPLHGVPVILKDNIDTGDRMATTAGSRALMSNVVRADSAVAERLRQAGAVIIAKANLSEWANFRAGFSSSGWSGVGWQTRNPYILDRNPCGSSAGSGVAVSANLCTVAIGTETNGSIVCPSNNNGIVGIKPTVGLVSRRGIIPISFTQDTAGPMTRTVADAATLLQALAGSDAADEKTREAQSHIPKDYRTFLNKDGLKGKRIGLVRSLMGYHHRVDALMEKTVARLRESGAEVVELEQLIDRSYESASYQVMLYEFKDGLNRYLAGLGDDAPVKNLAELIEFNKKDDIELRHFDQKILELAQAKGGLDSPEYLKALEEMLAASRKNGIDRVMDELKLDALMAPTGAPAWKTDLVNGDHFMGDSSSPAAISGYPNITLPMGFIDDLPVGISFFGRAWSEGLLIEIASGAEHLLQQRRPPRFLQE
jgi:amidase